VLLKQATDFAQQNLQVPYISPPASSNSTQFVRLTGNFLIYIVYYGAAREYGGFPRCHGDVWAHEQQRSSCRYATRVIMIPSQPQQPCYSKRLRRFPTDRFTHPQLPCWLDSIYFPELSSDTDKAWNTGTPNKDPRRMEPTCGRHRMSIEVELLSRRRLPCLILWILFQAML
jgi:hypothetical protein